MPSGWTPTREARELAKHLGLEPRSGLGELAQALAQPRFVGHLRPPAYLLERWGGWQHPCGKPILEDAARLSAAFSVLGRASARYGLNLNKSWQYANAETEGVGGSSGLSNGSYRAEHVQDGKNQNPDSLASNPYTLRATIAWRPGTLQMKIRGQTQARPPRDARRGKIRGFAPATTRRYLEHTRELEALGFRPEWMISLTYPADWRAALCDTSPCRSALAELWQRMDALKGKIAQARKLCREGADPWLLNELLAMLAEMRSEARRLVAECRKLAPDGRQVKAHLSAWLKRFDRAFGLEVRPAASQAEAHRLAELMQAQGWRATVRANPSKSKTHPWAAVAPKYRLLWWLEFQRRGAPHLHLMFYDVRGIDLAEVRAWAGHNWAGVVAGLRGNQAAAYDVRRGKLAELIRWADDIREFWPKEAVDGMVKEAVEKMGLDWEVFKHARAGTRVERMEKEHWGYAAKEFHGGGAKAYQKHVPRAFQNVGRWWGYRKTERAPKQHLSLEIGGDPEALRDFVLKPLEAAVNTLPGACFRYAQKIGRFLEAVARGEDYGYITVWGDKAVKAALEAVAVA